MDAEIHFPFNMIFASWNVNSIRVRLEALKYLIDKIKPDLLFLQEIKSQEKDFPIEFINKLGYQSYYVCQKSYNGVSVLSKTKLTVVQKSLPGNEEDTEARYIECQIKDKNIRLACIYLPNGNPVNSKKFSYKLDWMERLYQHTQKLLALEEILILGGDFNIIPNAKDADNIDEWHDDALHHVKSLTKFRNIINLGFTDAFRTLDESKQKYTFWDYQKGSWQRNKGLRIDHFILSPQASDLLEDCQIEKSLRGMERPSDHVPIWCKLNIS